jgi:hypothetical protein
MNFSVRRLVTIGERAMIGAVPDKKKMWALGASIGVLVFFIFLMALAMLHRGTVNYPRDDAGLYKYHQDQCERPVSRSWMAEVHNTFSNVGYALAGVLILLRVRSWAGHVFGFNLILLSIMSGLYHATLRGSPQALDVAWVYAALLSLSVYVSYTHVQARDPLDVPIGVWIGSGVAWAILFGLSFLFNNGLATFLIMSLFIVAATAICYVLEKFPTFLNYVVPVLLVIAIPLLGYGMKVDFGWDSTWVFAALVGLVIIQLTFVMASAPKVRWSLVFPELLIIGAVFGSGILFRLGDGYHIVEKVVERKFLCFPDSLFFQAHAAWHVIGAAALVLAYDLMVQFQTNRDGDAGDCTVILPETSAQS